MSATSIAATAAGISGAFGLLGFIIYAVLHLDSKQPYLTPELIDAPKDAGIDPEAAQSMSPQRLRDWLESRDALSKEIITQLAAPESTGQLKRVLYTSFGLLVTALVLGVIAMGSAPDALPVQVENPGLPLQEPLVQNSSVSAGRDVVITKGFGSDEVSAILEPIPKSL